MPWRILYKLTLMVLKRIGSLYGVWIVLLFLAEQIEGRSWNSFLLVEAGWCAGMGGILWTLCLYRSTSRELSFLHMGYHPLQIYSPLFLGYGLWHVGLLGLLSGFVYQAPSFQPQNCLPLTITRALKWSPPPLSIEKEGHLIRVWQAHQEIRIDLTQSPLKQRSVSPVLSSSTFALKSFNTHSWFSVLSLGGMSILIRFLLFVPSCLFIFWFPCTLSIWLGWGLYIWHITFERLFI